MGEIRSEVRCVVSVLGRRPCGNGFGHPFGLWEWFREATHRPARAIVWGPRGRRDGPHAVWAGVAAPSIIGCDLILAVHGSLVTSIIESAGAIGFAAWVALGVVAGWIACPIPPDCEPTQAGRMLVGVLGAVLGGVVASLLGVGSAATFFSLGAWLVARAGATASLAIHSIHVGRSRPPHPPATR